MSELVERRGTVVGFADGQVQISLERASGCSGCGSRGSCASGSATSKVISVPLPGSPRIGDTVTVSMPASSVALAALIGYLLPPVCLLLGAMVAAGCYDGDVAAVLGAALGFVGGLLAARLISRFAFGLSPAACHPASSSASSSLPGEHP
jgi:sigma-E factor negative regulatory protein RseC